ncbi:MAG: biopolymer transporter ExbD [Deltaproteobacteria bacterium]|nr:biopolymer transporter ExbD [Deltaproteobacteria bacterium]
MAGPVRDDDELLSDINITPFVDVVLVILIIFLVTATYIITKSIPMDLPKAATGEQVVTTLAISLDARGTIYLDGRPIEESRLVLRLREVRAEQPDVRAVIAADGGVEYRRVMRLMDLCRKQGISRLAFNIKSDDQPVAAAGGAAP